MTPSDREYLRLLLASGLLHGPALEVGSQAIDGQGGNTEADCKTAGLEWTGVDLEPGPGVTQTLDILDDTAVAAVGRQWKTLILFNILEHVYDPAKALRNALSLTAAGGHIAVVTPTVWWVHDFPRDYWRPLPDFYLEFAERHNATVVDEGFQWILDGQLIPVSELSVGKQKALPGRWPLGEKVFGDRRLRYSRLVNGVTRTMARRLVFPPSALGVVIAKHS